VGAKEAREGPSFGEKLQPLVCVWCPVPRPLQKQSWKRTRHQPEYGSIPWSFLVHECVL